MEKAKASPVKEEEAKMKALRAADEKAEENTSHIATKRVFLVRK
jgi:hypothetical protein